MPGILCRRYAYSGSLLRVSIGISVVRLKFHNRHWHCLYIVIYIYLNVKIVIEADDDLRRQ